MTEPRLDPADAPDASGGPAQDAPEARPTGRPAHRDGNVLRWLSAYAASLVGDAVYFLALGWAAAQAGGPAEVGLIMASGAVPRAVLMLGGGVIADRFGPRRIVIVSDAVRCAMILGIAAALMLTGPAVWLLVLVALVFGAVDALFMPAVGALPPRITAPDQLVRVQGMKALANRFGGIVGAPVAGLAMGLGGAAAAFAVAGVLFAVSLVLLVAVRIAPLPQEEPAREGDEPQRSSVWRDLTDGFGYVRRHRLVGPLILSNILFELGGIPLINVGVVLLSSQRGWGATGIAWIVGAFSAGAASTALLLTARGRVSRAGRVRLAGLAGGSVLVCALGSVPGLVWAVLVAAPMGMLVALCGGLTAGLVQTATAPAYLGRVSSLMSLISLGIAPLAYPVVGAAIGLWGATPVFWGCGALCLAAGLVGVSYREVREAELPGG
ncbi:MFS transporter [Streptomyces candidus]|uniref:MFS family permease n=1 Tax=Streptomyces candidus TaxID=67283 RepID=A0A7X0H9V4_9ACTN|nr:MFS transporter [Streptomyces candidus]MBB6433689.1 MFS family permease [Streptomyces candidus]GHH34953.1 MFS transporter [Streptomyces candidus]